MFVAPQPSLFLLLKMSTTVEDVPRRISPVQPSIPAHLTPPLLRPRSQTHTSPYTVHTSPEHVARWWPEASRQPTMQPCCSASPICLPVSTSQILTDPSSLPLTRHSPPPPPISHCAANDFVLLGGAKESGCRFRKVCKCQDTKVLTEKNLNKGLRRRHGSQTVRMCITQSCGEGRRKLTKARHVTMPQ